MASRAPRRLQAASAACPDFPESPSCPPSSCFLLPLSFASKSNTSKRALNSPGLQILSLSPAIYNFSSFKLFPTPHTLSVQTRTQAHTLYSFPLHNALPASYNHFKHTALTMSSSAVTPSAPSSKVLGSGHGPSLEPSPASTYGDSAASDVGDSPQTPGGENDGTYLEFLFMVSELRTLLLLAPRNYHPLLPNIPPLVYFKSSSKYH